MPFSTQNEIFRQNIFEDKIKEKNRPYQDTKGFSL
jgi:hypothetical protein